MHLVYAQSDEALSPEVLAARDARFRQETTIVATRLRIALIQVINQTVGPVQRTRDVRERLGLDVQASWQICKVATSDQPLELCAFIPSSSQLQRLLNALRNRGATEAALNSAQTAMEEYERHVAHYADSREIFNSIVAHVLRGEYRDDMELAHRRSAFEAQRFIWGIETKVSVVSRIFHPSVVAPGKYDLAVTHVKHKMTTFNPRVPLLVEAVRDMLPPEAGDDIPLDPKAYQRFGTYLLPDLSSQADLPLRTYRRADGALITHLVTDTVGNPSSVDLTFGRVHRPYKLLEHNGRWEDRGSFVFTTPVVRFVNMLLFHRPTIKNPQIRVTRWGHASDLPQLPEGGLAADLRTMGLPELPFAQKFAFMGSGRSAVEVPDLPQQLAGVEYACQSQGWNLEEMDVYQCLLDYPLMDSMIVLDVSFDQ